MKTNNYLRVVSLILLSSGFSLALSAQEIASAGENTGHLVSILNNSFNTAEVTADNVTIQVR